MGNCFYFRMVSGASLLSQAEDEWFSVHCFPEKSFRQMVDRPPAPVRGKGGGQGREGQSVLALWTAGSLGRWGSGMLWAWRSVALG